MDGTFNFAMESEKTRKKNQGTKIEKNGDATDGKFGALSVVQR